MDEQAQGEFVHLLALGKRERLAHEAAQTLAQGVVPTLDAAGLTRAFAGAAMRALRKHFGVSQPEVAAGGTTAVAGRDTLTQRASAGCRAVTDEVGDHLAGLPTQSDPDPADVEFGAAEAEEFIQFQHVARLGGQKRFAQRRETRGFFCSQREIVCLSTPKTRCAARRLKRSVATARSTSALRSGAVSLLRGRKTRNAPHARQETVGGRRRFCRF